VELNISFYRFAIRQLSFEKFNAEGVHISPSKTPATSSSEIASKANNYEQLPFWAKS
jgi:hypothetical protein